MKKKNLVISFSGGETSGLMTRMLLEKWRDKFDEVIVVFMNTSQENDATLDFIKECDEAYGFGTVWLEAVPYHGERKACGHKIITHETAMCGGEVFEDIIKKHGIPNQKFLHCTRTLKMEPLKSYLRSIGWKKGTFVSAVGIRADEARRRGKNSEADGVIYPLMDYEPLTKQDVNSYWESQSFRLNLAGYQGNCKWCWKKSFRKHLTIIDDDPSIYDFPERMEREYGLVGAEFRKADAVLAEGYCRTFFRGNLSVKDLRAMYADRKDEWCRAENDAIVYSGKEISLDIDDGCVESCEVDFAELQDD